MLRKWQFIAQKLEEFGLPSEFILYAKNIDETLCKLGLDYPTHSWREFVESELYKEIKSVKSLYYIITGVDFCTACEDATEKSNVYGGLGSCIHCKLSNCIPKSGCTPEVIYETDWYYRICYYIVANFKV